MSSSSSSYTGARRAGGQVNFSNFIQDLNEIPPQDVSPTADDWEKDLAMFTNTNFMDWDQPRRSADLPAQQPKEKEAKPSPAVTGEQQTASNAASSAFGDFDFTLPGDDFSSFDFGTFANPSVPNFSDNLASLQPLQPGQQAYPSAAQQGPYAVPPQAGTKRPSDASHNRQVSFEEQSRMAAEEDKRRRNTAASARFRIKKKAREQALERREKELNDEVTQLKNRITHLETENKWLRGLVMEKTGAKESKFDPKLAAALKVLGKDSDSEDDDKKAAKAEEAEAK